MEVLYEGRKYAVMGEVPQCGGPVIVILTKHDVFKGALKVSAWPETHNPTLIPDCVFRTSMAAHASDVQDFLVCMGIACVVISEVI